MNSEYYSSISKPEYDILMNRHVNFLDEKVKILKFLNKNGILYENDYIGTTNREIIKVDYWKKTRLIITRVSDDWYIVHIPMRTLYYKCDQLDGLILLIKDYFELN